MSLPAVLKSIFGMMLLTLVMVGSLSAEPVDGDQQQTIRRWIRQLDADRYAERQQAADELAKLGKDAIPEIEKAALTGTGEVASRSVDLLKGYAGSPDDEISSMAYSALKRLAASGNQTAGYIAEEAIAQLKRKLGPDRITDGEPEQPPVLPPGNFNRSVRISNDVNGDKVIDVTENGERVVARTMANGHVSITWHLPGGKQQKVEAESIDKLQQKDPQALAKFQELNKIADAGPGRLPGMPDPPRVHVRVPRAGEGFDPFAEMDQRMEEMRARHEQFVNELRQNMQDRRQLPQVAAPSQEVDEKQLKEVRQRLSDVLKRLEEIDADAIDHVDLKRLDEALKRIEAPADAS
ncbi:hypothetical protein C5Y96_04470 [Blastopirellula marina]|uniref:HEAT repeat domain-containing protein n=1 Tax=Blastopirellula marina TaxID=124 RepID=A0A2S8G3T9_9BACT|nr:MULTISPECIES: hypothetical protein [Pirellulaceae]PQO39122.1 hypothetical protein C5Y96_04470 [Blastopirellula marina]RCS55430.1 hypothetical protein DTL36_04480 [Bremerella cremea]